MAAIERAVEFGRFRAHDVRSILAAGTGVPRPARPGDALIVDLPDRRHPLARRLRHRGAGHEHHAARPARRPGGRTAPTAPRRHAPPRPRAAGGGQDPALEARGVPPHLGRGRDRLTGRLERPGPDAGGRLPGEKDPRRVRRRCLVGPPGHLRLPGQPRVDRGQGEPLSGRTGRHRQEPSARRPRPPRRRRRQDGSATSPPPIWSRPSTGVWPTTPSAG